MLDSDEFARIAKAAREAEKARYLEADKNARTVLQATISLHAIPAELHKIETTISTWCARMAWPGAFPTPPFDAWERRASLHARLSEARTYLEIARPEKGLG